ncbi:GbsR/MarR family transcriptional regulator [Gordonia jacobaea]|uniref:GbsR/MarR family transcriptional regulator n=1 Tax=Gordonia jacobaea TaxID=122202 RepID=UPI003D725EDC
MSARIFATLMAAASGRHTASELSSRLGVGPSAISNGAKMLRSLGLVDVTRQSDRQIVYEVRPDTWMEAVAHQDGELRTLEGILTEGARATAEPEAAARLIETADFFAFLRAELPSIIQRWRDAR